MGVWRGRRKGCRLRRLKLVQEEALLHRYFSLAMPGLSGG